MNLDKNVNITVRLKENIDFFINEIKADTQKNMINEIISRYDTVLSDVLNNSMGTSANQSMTDMPINSKIGLCESKSIIGADLKRILNIFIQINDNISNDDSNSLNSENNLVLVDELFKLCDNELFKLVNVQNHFDKDVDIKESLLFIYAVIASAMVESLIK